MKHLGEKIYQYRTQKGLSQQELAEKLNVSRQSVSKWEVGGAVPDLARLKEMAALFGVTLDELVSEEAETAEVLEENREGLSCVTKKNEEKRWIPPLHFRAAVLLAIIGIALSIVIGAVVSLILSSRQGLPPMLLGMPLSFHLMNVAPFFICAALCLRPPKRLALSCAWVAVLAVYFRLDLRFGVNWYDAILSVQYLQQGRIGDLLLSWLVLLLLVALMVLTARTCHADARVLTCGQTCCSLVFFASAPILSWLLRRPTQMWQQTLAERYPNANDISATLFVIAALEWLFDVALFLAAAYLFTRLWQTAVSKKDIPA